ncbi:MAG: hypothetical protein M0Z32_00820 [Actinomycetota bacterium]|jgi:hypothetical protein|nr:hypothetical protein [Actinomycetota bacterium]MCL6092379.1 hypothetical protein [Actinomycetota bacterium]MDA8166288.1 hypothetical protein [Actinomycetota bacterium]
MTKAINIELTGGTAMKSKQKKREPYAKPELVKHDNLKEITFGCANWQCSVTVPSAP